MKKSSEVNGEIHLQASGFFKDIRIQMLSDDNFSEVCFILLSFALFSKNSCNYSLILVLSQKF